MSYDNWLENQAEEYYRGCEPTIIESGYEYEGGGEYSQWYRINCEECEEKNCEYWSKYND